MIAGKVAGLGVIILGLSGAIAFELTDRATAPAGMASRPIHPVNAGPRDRAAPARSLINDRLTEILARPIFSPDRRPIASGARSVTGLSRLTGVIITESRRIAIFAAPQGGRPMVAEEGSRINAYEIRAITGAGVTLAGPGGATIITPIFDAAPPQSSKPQVPPPRLELPRTLKPD